MINVINIAHRNRNCVGMSVVAKMVLGLSGTSGLPQHHCLPRCHWLGVRGGGGRA